MKNDFKPVVDHRFNLRADWGAVDCQVLAVEPNKTLSYTWGAYGLESVVTWTLTPTSTGTHLRMEQSGFRPDQQQAYQGAKHGWPQFFANLEQVLARIADVISWFDLEGTDGNERAATMKKATTAMKKERLEGRKRRTLSLCADRCENQGAE